jgi:hypothetical protein
MLDTPHLLPALEPRRWEVVLFAGMPQTIHRERLSNMRGVSSGRS